MVYTVVLLCMLMTWSVLIADFPAELQALLDIAAAYASTWRYLFNASKSFVLVFGESPRSRSRLRAQRSWHIGSQLIKECDETKHLGILRSVNCSFLPLVLDRCKAARSAFYSLFPVASSCWRDSPHHFLSSAVFRHLFTDFIVWV